MVNRLSVTFSAITSHGTDITGAFSPESSVSVHFSCFILPNISIYLVLLTSGLMRKNKWFDLGLSGGYIPAAGQPEP